MIERFHGMDQHKKFSTISVLNREGEEVQFLSACHDLRRYIEDLGPEDAVILEACSGAFWWADRIEAQGATCYVLDPNKFRIIKDSWKKTDKYEARNMVKAIWVHLVTGEFGIPCVYKPSAITRELRKLFSQYELLNRQIRMRKCFQKRGRREKVPDSNHSGTVNRQNGGPDRSDCLALAGAGGRS